MSDRVPATGRQFEITNGGVRAIITEVGATLRLFEVDGVAYTETFPEDQRPPMGAGAVMVPWPGRVADGQWTLHGDPQQLALTEPERHTAIHGLLQHVPWQLVEHAESTVVLHAMVAAQPGWPIPLLTSVGYAVSENGLTVTHTVENLGARPVPFGVGAHPYLRVGDHDTDDCSLRLAASTVLPVDPERFLPDRPPRELRGDEQDFRRGRSLRGVWLNTSFGGCAPLPDDQEQLVRHAVLGPDSSGVELWAEPVFRWVQAYTPEEFPERGKAIAVEPQTCPPEALNSGTDLIVLQPGEDWIGSWGLRKLG